MWIGCFGEVIFSVSSLAVFTPNNIAGSTGSEWAEHKVLGGKPKAQYLAPKLKKFTFEITLDAKFGVQPRPLLELLHIMAEEGYVGYLIIGSMPVGLCQYRLTDVSEEWEVVQRGGKLTRCKVNLTLEEYV